MADSKRQLICTALDTRLKTILIANGYSLNLGTHVYEWHVTPLELVDLPACIWKDISEDDSNATIGGTIGYHNHNMKIELTIIVSGNTAPAQIRQALGDIQKAIGVDQTFGGLAQRTDPVSNKIDIEQQEKTVGGLTITVSIQYLTKKWNPYT